MYTYLGTGGDSSQTLKGRNLERENEANVQRDRIVQNDHGIQSWRTYT